MNLEWVVIVFGIGILFWILILVLKNSGSGLPMNVTTRLEALNREQERLEKILKDEIGRSREESNTNERASREEINRQLLTLTQLNEQKLESIRQTLEKQLHSLQ